MKTKYFDINNKEITDPIVLKIINQKRGSEIDVTPIAAGGKHFWVRKVTKEFLKPEKSEWLLYSKEGIWSEYDTYCLPLDEIKKLIKGMKHPKYNVTAPDGIQDYFVAEKDGSTYIRFPIGRNRVLVKFGNDDYSTVCGNNLYLPKQVEHIPAEYIEDCTLVHSYTKDDKRVYIKDDSNLAFVGVPNAAKTYGGYYPVNERSELINAILGYKDQVYITMEDYNRALELLKEWREPKVIRGTDKPPYFIVNGSVFQAQAGESWYAYLLRIIYDGKPQEWMFA